MKKVNPSARFTVRARHGSFTVARLLADGEDTQASRMRDANGRLLKAGRSWEDADIDLPTFTAGVEKADLDLDTVSADVRRALAARSADATEKAPYVLIYPQGHAWYAEAPQDEQVKRYQALIDRLRANLDPSDAIVVDKVPLLVKLLASWEEAFRRLGAAQTAVEDQRVALVAVEGEWDQIRDAIYSQMREKLGAKAADRYFR